MHDNKLDHDIRDYLGAVAIAVESRATTSTVSAPRRSRVPRKAFGYAAIAMTLIAVTSVGILGRSQEVATVAGTTPRPPESRITSSSLIPHSGVVGSSGNSVAEYGSHAVWTGEHVIALYTENGGGQVDGERIDVTTGTSTRIAPSPLEWRSDPAVVWTGEEILVTGGSSFPDHEIGAAYSPQRDAWRTVPRPPLDGIRAPTVWTGTHMIAWSSGLAYEPKADRWSTIPQAPLLRRINEVAVLAGGRMVVWGGCDINIPDCEDDPSSWFNDGAEFDPGTNQWTPLPATDLPGSPHPVAVAHGDAVWIISGSSTSRHTAVASYSPATRAWEMAPTAPVTLGYGADLTDVNGRLVLTGGNLATPVAQMYDTATRSWAPLPGNLAPRMAHKAAWTGSALVIAGGAPASTALVYRTPALGP